MENEYRPLEIPNARKLAEQGNFTDQGSMAIPKRTNQQLPTNSPTDLRSTIKGMSVDELQSLRDEIDSIRLNKVYAEHVPEILKSVDGLCQKPEGSSLLVIYAEGGQLVLSLADQQNSEVEGSEMFVDPRNGKVYFVAK